MVGNIRVGTRICKNSVTRQASEVHENKATEVAHNVDVCQIFQASPVNALSFLGRVVVPALFPLFSFPLPLPSSLFFHLPGMPRYWDLTLFTEPTRGAPTVKLHYGTGTGST